MQKPSLKLGTVLGLITSLPLIAVAYLGNALVGLPFLPFALFDWLARVLPGPLITFGIDSMVSTLRALGLSVSETAKLAEQLMALAIVVVAGAVFGFLVALLMRRWRRGAVRAGILAGVPFFLLFLTAELGLGISGNFLLVILWIFALTFGWGATIGAGLQWMAKAAEGSDAPDMARRDALLKLAGTAAGVSLGAWGLGRLSASAGATIAEGSGAGQPLPTAMPTSPGATRDAAAQSAEIPATPSGRIEMPPGTRSEITSNDDFYRIDINMVPPVIEEETWQLEIDGLFQSPRNLTIADLMAYPAVTQPITIGCISNQVGGDLIGTSYWTGARLRDVLEDLQLQPEAGALFIESEDGFYETVIAEDMMDERTLLVYGMNGETLPVEHGFPLRIYIPNRYGMKQPKWMLRMRAIEAWTPGYWVERGWSREARPHIVSVIDTIAVDAGENGQVPVAGIAWAGDRGIAKVEVRVDDGPWEEAQLRTPPISNLTWVQWRYDWTQVAGRHTFTVRATDGKGELQTDEINDPHPDGATGYHSLSASV